MKQKEVLRNPLEQTTNRLEVSNSGVSKKLVVKTSIAVPGAVEVKKIVKPEMVTLVNSPTTRTPSITDEPLCDDILSCISALDEVIAEFDDSISQSSTSSVTSVISGTPSPQKLSSSGPRSSVRKETERKCPQSPTTSSSSDEFGPIVKIMQKEADEKVTEIHIRNLASQKLTSKSIPMDQQPRRPPPTKFSPIKPARQSKGTKGNSYRSIQLPYQIEGNSNGSPPKPGNYTSYGIVFPKSTNSPAGRTFSNNNNNSPSPTSHSPPKVTVNVNTLIDSAGTESTFSKVQVNKSTQNNSRMPPVKLTSSVSSHKPIPVTFVMKPEDLERFLKNDTEEDWNCHIEKNLPRSLRKTRKTCFVEDDEEEQEKYCRSPKDFRKNLPITNDPKLSPMLSQRKTFPEPQATHTQWMRYEDVNVMFSQESKSSNLKSQSSTSFSQVQKMTSVSDNNNVVPLSIVTDQNSNEERLGSKSRPPESLLIFTSPPVTADQVLDIDDGRDDGYLSMINRHEIPILWPEGGIETEVYSVDELKRLSVSNLNYLNEESNKKEQILKTEDKNDYFSDDSLEFEGDTEYCHQKVIQTDKMSSFIHATPPTAVPSYINKSSTRKSWSPGSEIRFPGKPIINTNTWRKGDLPPSALMFDERQEDCFVFQKKVTSPVRPPCAFFIPMNPNLEDSKVRETLEQKVTPGKRKNEDEENGTEFSTLHSLDSIANKITKKVMESGIQEAACITTLLASTVSMEELNETFVTNLDMPDSIFESAVLSEDLRTFPEGRGTSVNSSLGLSAEDKLSSSGSEQRELESTSSSSGIDYQMSSVDHEHNYETLPGEGYNLLVEEDRTDQGQGHEVLDDIEDIHDNPPPFIPPPPQVVATTPILEPRMQNIVRSSEPQVGERVSVISRESESDRDSFPQSIPSRVNPGERVLRTQRQTSRSHENLLDIDRKEYLPVHPCVRRGHSATLPSNAVPPVNGRRPSALRQFFGIFRRNKKQSNTSGSSILDLPTTVSPSFGLKEFDSSVCYDDTSQLPEHFTPYKSNRPSISESHGSQRSNTSKTSTKRSVLSRIFRRKEK